MKSEEILTDLHLLIEKVQRYRSSVPNQHVARMANVDRAVKTLLEAKWCMEECVRLDRVFSTRDLPTVVGRVVARLICGEEYMEGDTFAVDGAKTYTMHDLGSAVLDAIAKYEPGE